MVSKLYEDLPSGADLHHGFPRLLGIFDASRLQVCGCALAALYAVLLASLYKTGFWIHMPVGCRDSGAAWRHRRTLRSRRVREDPGSSGWTEGLLLPELALPPTFFFVLIPSALLPYAYAFIIWDVLTLTGCIVVVYLIVRRGGLARLQDARPAAGEPLVCTTHRWRELNSNF